MTKVPYRGTEKQEEKLKEIIAYYKGKPGATMPVLQQAQEIFGYLPEEVQIMIAEGLDLPLSEVYGVATFYAQFSLNPKGKYQVSVCLGTACYVKGSADILEAVKDKLGCERVP
jgi:NADH-quinone oxidoreductase subunit E/NADP-reducing hydrogenase subunit HndA